MGGHPPHRGPIKPTTKPTDQGLRTRHWNQDRTLRRTKVHHRLV